MNFPALVTEAEEVVAAAKRKLPPPVAECAENLPVVFHDWPSDAILGDEFDDDILGLFVGDSINTEPGMDNATPAQILLFLASIYDYTECDLKAYREEVRITYLHELGHYLGWDEDDLDARGLG